MERIRNQMPAARPLFWQGWLFPQVTVSISEERWRSPADKYRVDCSIPKRLWDQLQQQIGATRFFPQDRMWLLRILTVKRLVSPLQISTATAPRYNIGSRMLRRGRLFEELLMMMASWAGPCFDIVTEERHKAEGDDGWEDVTARSWRPYIHRLMDYRSKSHISRGLRL
ncbi:uncharacterized protein RCO7_14345 [Rhynchosporium graminicola]|uniref:Uncharacterized protein n=1 Tax=Rhynchosporium graminicola TaxID=2792576 RepID=A0A1E1KA84_9HELO|nr:uncharacterized protein RCO7_14345 [Rhynchosporium commune]